MPPTRDTKFKPQELTDEQLAEVAADLAKDRTAIRLMQNAVQAEIDLRAALNTLPAESRRIVHLRLEGGIAPTGERS